MTTKLLSIISDQPIPNILFCREMTQVEAYQIDEYIFLVTERMEQERRIDNIIETLQLTPVQYRTIRIPEYDLSATEEVLRRAGLDRSSKYLVNITNGTKLMSTATYNFFTQQGFNAELYYVMFGKNEYRCLFPYELETIRKFRYRLQIPEYLQSHGVRICNQTAIDDLYQNPAVTEAFFREDWSMNLFERNKQVHKEQRNFLQKYFIREQRAAITFGELHEENARFTYFQQQLEASGFQLSAPETLTQKDWKYLSSRWLEEYVFTLFQEQLNLQTGEIAIGVQIETTARKAPYNTVKNELDVVFIFQNELHVAECKVNLATKSSGSNNTTDIALYKLAALKKDFGLQIRGYLFALHGLTKKRSKNIPASIENRAEILRITLITKSMLQENIQTQGLFQRLQIQLPRLFLVFSHQITDKQKKDALLSLRVPNHHIVALPDELRMCWSSVPTERTLSFSEHLRPITHWLREKSRTGDYVLIQGEFGAVFHLVNFCRRHGLTPLHSTTKRRVVEQTNASGEVEKRSIFDHVAFREYRMEY